MGKAELEVIMELRMSYEVEIEKGTSPLLLREHLQSAEFMESLIPSFGVTNEQYQEMYEEYKKKRNKGTSHKGAAL